MSFFGSSRVSCRSWLPPAAVTLLLGSVAVACGNSEGAPVEPGIMGVQPGGSSPTSANDGTCKTNSDCTSSGTQCTNGVCQMAQCAGQYTSNPPLGKKGYAWLDRQLAAVTSATTGIAAYDGSSTGAIQQDAQFGSLATPSVPLDIAGGNLTGSSPEPLAYVDGTTSLTVVGSDGTTKSITLPFAGQFLAAGDTDGDGVDELLVTDGVSSYAVCSAVQATCTAGTATLPGSPVDVAVGDMDGDGKAELLFAIGSTVFAQSATFKSVSWPTPEPLTYITASDLDGDHRAELVGKYSGGSIPEVSKDSLYVFDFANAAFSQSALLQIPEGSLDIAAWTYDGTPTIAVLPGSYIEDSPVQLYTFGAGAISMAATGTLANSGVTRLAAADLAGNSASVSLMAGPMLLPGPVVPIAVLTAPPYSASHSAAPATSSLGSSTDTGTGTSTGSSTSLSFSLSVGLFVGVPLIGGIGAFIGGSLSSSTSQEMSSQMTLSTSVSQSFTPDPTDDGYYSGHVVLGAGCFHQYDYALSDPTNHFGSGQGVPFTLFRPVGSDQKTFTTRQYASIASVTSAGQLPAIAIPYKLGDVSSYPSTPETLEGQPIPPADNVFTSPPPLTVSSSGAGNFSLTLSTSNTNSQSTSASYGASSMFFGQFGIVQVQGSADKTYTLDSSYSVTLGTSTTFSGDVSPIRQDSGTAEDEGALYGYTFTPYVYREHFTPPDLMTDAGASSSASPGYYVLTYAVTQHGTGD